LEDVYNRLDTNAAATPGGHSFSPSGSPAGSLYTIDQIYEKIPAIDGSKILSGTSYLGVEGTIAVKDGIIGNNGELTINLPDGYYESKTAIAADTNLISGNIKSGTSIFGVAGNYSGYTYGDNDASKVLTAATGAGTYNATNLTVGNVKSGISFGVSSTGTLLPNEGTAAAADLFSGKTAHLTGDWNLDTGTLNLACSTAVFDGDANKVADAYDGGGNGNNRWCTTDTGDATATNILETKKAWVDGIEVTGTMPVQTLSASNETVSAGYYATTTLSAVDADLAVGNIKSGVTIFGKEGTYTGTSKLPDTGQTLGYTATFGEDNDYTSANSLVCDRAASGTDASFDKSANNGTVIDNCTGLMWMMCGYGQTYSGGACTGSISTRTWEQALSYCEGLTFPTGGYTDWRLPNINELLSIVSYSTYSPSINQTYFPSTTSDSYWSSTTLAHYTNLAWHANFYGGYTGSDDKTGNGYARCVRD